MSTLSVRPLKSCIVLLLVAGLPGALSTLAEAYRIPCSVIGNSGISPGGGGLRIHGTLGQPWLGEMAGSGSRVEGGWWLGCGTTILLSADEGPPRTTVIELGHATPNPSRRSVTLSLFLPEPSWVEVRICDVTGRVVRSLLQRMMESGHQSVLWDGSMENGATCRAGAYFARVTVNGLSLSHRRIVLLR